MLFELLKESPAATGLLAQNYDLDVVSDPLQKACYFMPGFIMTMDEEDRIEWRHLFLHRQLLLLESRLARGPTVLQQGRGRQVWLCRLGGRTVEISLYCVQNSVLVASLIRGIQG